MKYLALDLELNQPSGKIIQVGWAVGTLDENAPIDCDFVFVNPKEILNPFIVSLTGISQEEVDKAQELSITTLASLYTLMRQPDVFRVPMTWGGGDMSCLKRQLGIQSTDMMHQGTETSKEMWPFARSEWDIKKLWQFYMLANNKPIQGGLAKSLTKVGLSFVGRKHQAQDDAVNTLRMARKLKTILGTR